MQRQKKIVLLLQTFLTFLFKNTATIAVAVIQKVGQKPSIEEFLYGGRQFGIYHTSRPKVHFIYE